MDAALAGLPPEGQLNFTAMAAPAEGGFGGGGANESVPPPKHGQKPLPEGHPDCLSGKVGPATGAGVVVVLALRGLPQCSLGAAYSCFAAHCCVLQVVLRLLFVCDRVGRLMVLDRRSLV